MTHLAAHESDFATLDTTSILNISFQVILFCIGFFAQIRIIKICKEEKNKTWQIHIFHAITMTVIYASRIIFMAIVYVSPSLFTMIGSWICHLLRFVFLSGFISITSNTFIIASMKYVFIVHAMRALAIGHSRIQKLFFWANLLVPFILSLDTLLPDFKDYGYMNICLNPELRTDATFENVQSHLQLHFDSIDFQEPNFTNFIHLALNMFRVFAYIITACNFTEALIYYLIFKFMKW